jgi:hypothetical protein
MMRCVSISMSFLVLLTSLRDLVTYVSFYLNQDYISQNLCVNKNKPALMCHGECVLTDSLIKNHEKKDNKTPISQQEERTIFILPTIVNILNLLSSLTLKKDSIAYKTDFYAFEYLEEVFHPPSLLS